MESHKETYTNWVASEKITGRYSLESLLDSKDGVEIRINSTNQPSFKLCIKFEAKEIVGYRFSNDSYTWRSDSLRERDKDFSLFIVSGSNLINWYIEETYETTDFSEAKHYCFLLAEESIDIISFAPPKITEL